MLFDEIRLSCELFLELAVAASAKRGRHGLIHHQCCLLAAAVTIVIVVIQVVRRLRPMMNGPRCLRVGRGIHLVVKSDLGSCAGGILKGMMMMVLMMVRMVGIEETATAAIVNDSRSGDGVGSGGRKKGWSGNF